MMTSNTNFEKEMANMFEKNPIKNNFSVAIIEPNRSHRTVYEFINDIKEAYILAQYAMSHDRKNSSELVVIFPGYNIGISNDKDTHDIAAQLAEKYKCDNED